MKVCLFWGEKFEISIGKNTVVAGGRRDTERQWQDAVLECRSSESFWGNFTVRWHESRHHNIWSICPGSADQRVARKKHNLVNHKLQTSLWPKEREWSRIGNRVDSYFLSQGVLRALNKFCFCYGSPTKWYPATAVWSELPCAMTSGCCADVSDNDHHNIPGLCWWQWRLKSKVRFWL